MESHAKRFVPTESNDFFFYSIFFLREVFLWMDDNPQNFHGIRCLIFNVEFSISRKSKTCRTGT